jgi:hypothetical protein
MDGHVEIFAPRSNPEHALWLETHQDHWGKFEQNVKGHARRADAENNHTPSTASHATTCSPSFEL